MPTYEYMPGVPAMGHISSGGFWHPGAGDSCQKCHPPRTFIVSRSDIDRCPRRSLSPYHYNDDGTCKCPEEEK